MTASTSARRIAAGVSVGVLALAALAGCDRRQSDVPAPTPSSPTTTTPTTPSTGGTGSTAPMPGSAASEPMAPAAPASAASS